MPHEVAIFCKSFEDDFYRLRALLNSYEQHCSGIPFILSIPKSQAARLKVDVGLTSSIEVIYDEDYAKPSEVGNYGWFQQQVCKLSIHHTGLAEAYICVDSDAYFVNGLNKDDFFDGSKKRVIYSNLFTKFTPDNALLLSYLLDESFDVPPPPKQGKLDGFTERLAVFFEWLSASGDTNPIGRSAWINNLFEVPANTCLQPGQFFHAALLDEFERFFLKHGITLSDLIRLIPWEFNWYGCWATAAAEGVVSRSISPIVHFASDADVAAAKSAGITEEHLRKRFKVVQMAARHFDALTF